MASSTSNQRTSVPLRDRLLEPLHNRTTVLTEHEVNEWIALITQWQVVTHRHIMKLERSFEFNDFVAAMEFANVVCKASEQDNHHPSVMIEYGRTTVTWWTHEINGLHLNDFIMAAKTDESYQHVR